MKQFLTRYRIALLVIAVLSIILLMGAYILWVWYGKQLCLGGSLPDPLTPMTEGQRECSDFYNHSIFRPFFYGYLLKSLALSSLIMLFFSARAFRMWLVFAALTMVIGVAFIVTTPVNAKPFSKTVLSDWAGAILFGGTLLIALGTALYERWQAKRGER